MVLVHREPKKKYNSEPSIRDVPLYLVTTGPAKNIWTMSTMSKKELIELMPVFDREENVVNLLVELQEKTYQATTVSLGRLTTMVKDKKVLFILNPNVAICDGQLLLKEGPNWHLPLEQLSSLLSVEQQKLQEK